MKKAGFMTPDEVAEAQRLDGELDKNSETYKRVTGEAQAAMEEIEDIYFGGATYDAKTGRYRSRNIHSDELIDWIKSTGVDPEVLSGAIKLMKVGEVTIIKDRAFIKTPDQKFQEVGAYANRLEKTLLSFIEKNKTLVDENSALKADIKNRVEVLENIAHERDTFTQLIKRAFAKLFRRAG